MASQLLQITVVDETRGWYCSETGKGLAYHWQNRLMWALCTPALIFIIYAAVTRAFFSQGKGDWTALGITLLLAPVIVVLAYGGIVISVVVAILGYKTAFAPRATIFEKIEAVATFAISLGGSIWVHFFHF